MPGEDITLELIDKLDTKGADFVVWPETEDREHGTCLLARNEQALAHMRKALEAPELEMGHAYVIDGDPVGIIMMCSPFTVGVLTQGEKSEKMGYFVHGEGLH